MARGGSILKPCAPCWVWRTAPASSIFSAWWRKARSPTRWMSCARNMMRGADPVTVISELGGFIHLVTRLKVTPAATRDASLTDIEREKGAAFASQLSIRALSMLWQILLKGLKEISEAPRPLAAAEMLLVRLCHAADLATPDEALKALRDGGEGPASAPQRPQGPSGGAGPVPDMAGRGSALARNAEPARAVQAAPATAPRLANFAALVALAGEKRDLQLKRALEHDVRPLRFEEGRLEIALEPSASRQLVSQIAQRLQEWTGRPWMVALAAREAAEAAAPTLREIRSAEKAEALAKAEAHPLVQAALAQFAGATIADVRKRGEGASPAASLPEPPAPVMDADDLPYRIDDEPWADAGADFDD